jgi:hypothetical protein
MSEAPMRCDDEPRSLPTRILVNFASMSQSGNVALKITFNATRGGDHTVRNAGSFLAFSTTMETSGGKITDQKICQAPSQWHNNS